MMMPLKWIERKKIVLIEMKVLYPLTTEKAVGSIEKNNSLTFIITDDATKTEVKKEIEKAWGEKVIGMNTSRSINGRKKAVVRFSKKVAASEIASKLKLI